MKDSDWDAQTRACQQPSGQKASITLLLKCFHVPNIARTIWLIGSVWIPKFEMIITFQRRRLPFWNVLTQVAWEIWSTPRMSSSRYAQKSLRSLRAKASKKMITLGWAAVFFGKYPKMSKAPRMTPKRMNLLYDTWIHESWTNAINVTDWFVEDSQNVCCLEPRAFEPGPVCLRCDTNKFFKNL